MHEEPPVILRARRRERLDLLEPLLEPLDEFLDPLQAFLEPLRERLRLPK